MPLLAQKTEAATWGEMRVVSGNRGQAWPTASQKMGLSPTTKRNWTPPITWESLEETSPLSLQTGAQLMP